MKLLSQFIGIIEVEGVIGVLEQLSILSSHNEPLRSRYYYLDEM